MLEEVGRRRWRKRFRISTRWRTAKEVLAEAPCWNGGVYEEAESTEYESGEKIVGREFLLCSENTNCSVCKACMRNRRKEKR